MEKKKKKNEEEETKLRYGTMTMSMDSSKDFHDF